MTQRRHFLQTLLIACSAVMPAVGAFAANTSAAPAALDLVKPLAEYKLYVNTNLRELVKGVQAFTDAIKADKLDDAKKLYAQVRRPYERIEPIAELFADLDKSIDARADDYEKGEKDPAFTGFHRIEYGLWVEKSTKNLGPVADKLLADVKELQKRVATLTFPPEKVVGGAAVLMEEVAATKISGEEERYSHTDLDDFQANFEGADKIYTLMRPLVEKQNPAFVEKTTANFESVFKTLAKYRKPDGSFDLYSKLSERDRKMLSGKVNTLAEDLSQLRGMLGLN